MNAKQISVDAWRTLSPMARARIAAIYLATHRVITIKEAMSNNPLIAGPALGILEVELSQFIKGIRVVPYDYQKCLECIRMNWKLAFAAFAPNYYAMKAETRDARALRAKHFIQENLGDVDIKELIEGGD